MDQQQSPDTPDTPVEESKDKKFVWYRSIITYGFFFGINYVISQYISIPSAISFIFYVIFGGVAVLLTVNPETLKKLKNVPLLRKHFSMMYKINTKIRETFIVGTLKGSFKFAGSMLSLVFYFAWLNLLLNTMKYLASLIVPNLQNPFQWVEAFFCLLGAGLIAFIKWFVFLVNHQKEAKLMLKSDTSRLKVKSKIKFVGKQFSFLVALQVLGTAYIIWAGGLTIFLLTNPDSAQFLLQFLLGVGIFFAILVVSLLLMLVLIAATQKAETEQE
ncbi:MAG: hypothetical protein ACTSRK_13885 [Promethearchaeota archaeon]